MSSWFSSITSAASAVTNAVSNYTTGGENNNSSSNHHPSSSAMMLNSDDPMLRGRIPTDFVLSDTISQNTTFFPMKLSPFLQSYYQRTGGATTSYTLIQYGVDDAMKLLDLVSVDAGSQVGQQQQQEQYHHQHQNENINIPPQNNNNNNDGFDEITGDEASRLTSEFAQQQQQNNNNNSLLNNEYVDISTLKQKLREEFDAASELFQNKKTKAAGIVNRLERVAGLAFLFQMNDFCDAYATVFHERIIKVIHPSTAGGAVNGGGINGAAVRNFLPRTNTFASTNDLSSLTPSKYNSANPSTTHHQGGGNNNVANNNNNSNSSSSSSLYELLLQANKIGGGIDTSSATTSQPLTEERLKKSAAATRASLFHAVYFREPTEKQRHLSDDEWNNTYKPLFPINSAFCASIALYQSAGDILGNENHHPLARLSWEPDESVTECRACKQPFSLTLRRSHCRCCGKIYCKSCLDPTKNNRNNLVASEDCYFSTTSNNTNNDTSGNHNNNNNASSGEHSSFISSANYNNNGDSSSCHQYHDGEVEYDTDIFIQQQQTRQQFAHTTSALLSKKYEKACLECASFFGEGRRVRFLQDLIERCGLSIVEVHIVALIDSDWKIAATRVLRLYKESIYTGKPDSRHDRMVLATASHASKHPQLLLRLARLTSPNYNAQKIDHQQAQAQFERDNPKYFKKDKDSTSSSSSSYHRKKRKYIVSLPPLPYTSQLWDLSHPDYDSYRATSVGDQICAVMINQNDEMSAQIFSHGQLACTRACGFSLADRGTFAVLVVTALAHIPSVYYEYTPVVIDVPSTTSSSSVTMKERGNSTLSINSIQQQNDTNNSNNGAGGVTSPNSSPSFNQTSNTSFGSFEYASAGAGAGGGSSSSDSSLFRLNFNSNNNLHHQHYLTPIVSSKPLTSFLPMMSTTTNSSGGTTTHVTNQHHARRIANGTKMIVYTESKTLNHPVMNIREKAQLALVGIAPSSDFASNQLLYNNNYLPATATSSTSRHFTRDSAGAAAAPTPRADLIVNANASFSNFNNQQMQELANNPNIVTLNDATGNGSGEAPLVTRSDSSRLSVWLYALTDLLTDSTTHHHSSSSSSHHHHSSFSMDKNSADCVKNIIQRTIRGNRGLMLKTYCEFHSRCTFVGRWNRSQFEEIIKSISDDDLRAQFQHLDVFFEVLNDVARKKPMTSEQARICIENALPRGFGGGGGGGSLGGDHHHHHAKSSFVNTTITNFGGSPIEIGPSLDRLDNAAKLHPHSKRIVIKENVLKIIDLEDPDDEETKLYLKQEEIRKKNWWSQQQQQQQNLNQQNNNQSASSSSSPKQSNNNNNSQTQNLPEPPPSYRARHHFIPIHPVLYPFDHNANKFIIAIDIANVKTLSSNSKPIYIPLVCQEIVTTTTTTSSNSTNNVNSPSNNSNNTTTSPPPNNNDFDNTTTSTTTSEIKLEYRPILLKMENVWRDHLAREFAFILYDLMTAKSHHHHQYSNPSQNNNGDILMSCLKQDMYSALPLSEECGIVEWLDDETVVPLEKILKSLPKDLAPNNNNKDSQKSNPAGAAAVAGTPQNQNQNNITVPSIAPITSYSPLRQYLLSASRDPLDTRRQVFCRSVQFSILLCHILGVSDRHLSNVMINTRTLAIVDIDFGHMFGSRTWTEQVDLLGKNLLLSVYYSASGPTHQIHGLTCARFDPMLAEAVTEVRFQATQAQRELRKRRQQDTTTNQNQNQQPNERKSSVTITKVPSTTIVSTTNDNNNTNTNNQTPEELQKQEYEKLLKQREAALDDFISETAKMLFVKIRPHMDIISLLFTKSSRYLDDLESSSSSTNNNNNNQSSKNNNSSSANCSNNNNSSSNGNNNSNNNSLNDERIAEHFFHCFALTKTDSDAQDSFRKELKEMRSRYFQDLMHTANQMGAMGLLNAGLDSMRSFFGGGGGSTASLASSNNSNNNSERIASPK